MTYISRRKQRRAATSAAPTSDSSPAPSTSSVPDGSVDEVLAWAGDDYARRAAALASEQARKRPRKTLLAALEA